MNAMKLSPDVVSCKSGDHTLVFNFLEQDILLSARVQKTEVKSFRFRKRQKNFTPYFFFRVDYFSRKIFSKRSGSSGKGEYMQI